MMMLNYYVALLIFVMDEIWEFYQIVGVDEIRDKTDSSDFSLAPSTAM